MSIFLKESGNVYGWGKNEYGELGLGHNKYTNEPTEISTLSKIEVIPFETMCYFIGEWNTTNHKLFSTKTKEQIKTILLLSLFNSITKQPQHPSCYFYKLPRDIRFEIFKFISTSQLGIWNNSETKFNYNTSQKRKRN